MPRDGDPGLGGGGRPDRDPPGCRRPALRGRRPGLLWMKAPERRVGPRRKGFGLLVCLDRQCDVSVADRRRCGRDDAAPSCNRRPCAQLRGCRSPRLRPGAGVRRLQARPGREFSQRRHPRRIVERAAQRRRVQQRREQRQCLCAEGDHRFVLSGRLQPLEFLDESPEVRKGQVAIEIHQRPADPFSRRVPAPSPAHIV